MRHSSQDITIRLNNSSVFLFFETEKIRFRNGTAPKRVQLDIDNRAHVEIYQKKMNDSTDD